MAFDWGGFAGGMAKTWNSGAIGGAINQTVAQGREEDAVKAATEKRDQALKTLDAQRGGQPNVEVKPVQALPTQADNVGVDAVSSAGGNEMKPISDVEYDARKAAIETDFSNAKKQARADYYKFRGMEAEQRKTEDELEQAKWHQGQVNFYKDVVAGNPQAVGKLVGYMNASMGDGSQIVQNEDGTMSLMGANGQPIQANFKPSLEQINSAFTNYYNTAKFFHDNDFSAYLTNDAAIQKKALDARAADRADAELDEKGRHNRASEALTAEGHKVTMRGQDIAAETTRRGQDISAETTRRGQTLSHTGEMAKLGETKRHNEELEALEKDKLKQSLEKLKADLGNVDITPNQEVGGFDIFNASGDRVAWQDQDGNTFPLGFPREQAGAYGEVAKKVGARFKTQAVQTDRGITYKAGFEFPDGTWADTPEEAAQVYAETQPAAIPTPKEAKKKKYKPTQADLEAKKAAISRGKEVQKKIGVKIPKNSRPEAISTAYGRTDK